MTKHRKTWLLVGILAVAPVCVFLLICKVGGYTTEVARRPARNRILHGDHAEILRACRQMISNYAHYDGDFSTTYEGEKGLRFTKYTKDEVLLTYATDARLPEAIRRVEPRFAIVGTNYMYIRLNKPFRTLIIADGGGASEMITNRFRLYQLVLLTNGLWFAE
jgi:hypothetical protein